MIGLRRGDLTTARADAIVCSVGGALEQAVQRAAGPALAEALDRLGRPGAGEVAVTHAGALGARVVLHTRAPSAGTEALRACYRAVFTQAAALGCRTVAAPAVGAGAGAGFALPAVAEAALGAAHAAASLEVCFWLDEAAHGAFDRAMVRHTPPLRPTRAGDWELQPWPALTPLAFEQTLTGEEADRLSLGFLPREMEDKWFVHRDGGQLLIHRSWTGILIYRVALDPIPDGGLRLHNVLFNADPDTFSGGEAAARSHLAGVIGLTLQSRS